MTLEALESEHAQAQRRALNCLKRTQGQLDAIIRAIGEGRQYSDTVMQLAAVNSTLQRTGFFVISSTMRNCTSSKEQTPEDVEAQSKKLEKLFFSLS